MRGVVATLWLLGVTGACGARSELLPGRPQGLVGGAGPQPSADSSAGSVIRGGGPSSVGVTDESLPCDQAELQYQLYKQDQLAKYTSRGCTAGGCAPFVENNRCAVTCGTMIPAQWRDSMEQDLTLFAAKTCGACAMPPVPACLPWPPFSCFLNSCSFDSSHG